MAENKTIPIGGKLHSVVGGVLADASEIMTESGQNIEEVLRNKGGGESDYNALQNKPQIGGKELKGNQTVESLGLQESLKGKTIATINGTDVVFESNVQLAGSEGGSSIVVDPVLNSDSKNAIQNQAVAKELQRVDNFVGKSVLKQLSENSSDGFIKENGTFFSSAEFTTTDFRSVEELSGLAFNIKYVKGLIPLSFWTETKTFINVFVLSDISGIVDKDKIPQGAKFFRVSYVKNNRDNDILQAGSITGFMHELRDDYLVITKKISDVLLGQKFHDIADGRDLFSLVKLEGAYIDKLGRFLPNTTGFLTTPFIDISEFNPSFIFYHLEAVEMEMLPISFYDEKKNLIKGWPGYGRKMDGLIPYAIPENTKYYKLTTYKDWDSFALVGGKQNEEMYKIRESKGKASTQLCSNLFITGSSLTHSFYQPRGYGWIERINDLCDINIINIAMSGWSLRSNITWLLDDNQPLKGYTGMNDRQGNTNMTYLLSLNSANGTPADNQLIQYLEEMKDIASSRGAKLLLGTEEAYEARQGNAEYINKLYRTMSTFAMHNDIPFVDTYKSNLMCYPLNIPYAGFIHNSHGGYRVCATYELLLDMVNSLDIRNNVKAFRVRPNYKGGIYTYNDLCYDDNFERVEKYQAICCRAEDVLLNSQIDNMDTDGYLNSPSGGSNKGHTGCETAMLSNGDAVDFENYALIEIISDKIKSKKAELSIKSSKSPTHIYIAKRNNTYTQGDARSVFVENDFKYVDGYIRIVLTGKFQIYDKTKLLIQCDGQFKLTIDSAPNFTGISKPLKYMCNNNVELSQELNQQTDVSSGWNLQGGAVVKSFPDQIANYPAFNSSNAHVELIGNTSKMTKTISIPKGSKKIRVRVVAQSFTKICTTRFADQLGSKYISQVPVLQEGDYDFGTLIVNINGIGNAKRLIWKGWHETYYDFILNGDEESVLLSLGRDYIHDYQTRANEPILVYDVSVKVIL